MTHEQLLALADAYAAVTSGAVPDVDRYKIGLRIQEARAALSDALLKVVQDAEKDKESVSDLRAAAVILKEERDALSIKADRYSAALTYVAFYGKGDAKRIAEEALKEKP